MRKHKNRIILQPQTKYEKKLKPQRPQFGTCTVKTPQKLSNIIINLGKTVREQNLMTAII